MSGINYRRFFDINELAGLRVEDPHTFREMHGLVARLIAADQLQGLRLDHIDGLLDPMAIHPPAAAMIRRIRGAGRASPSTSWSRKSSPTASRCRRFPASPAPPATNGSTPSRGVLVDPARPRQARRAVARDRDPARGDFDAVLESAKLRVLDTIMASEFNVLVQLLEPHRRRPFQHARLCRRPPARGAACSTCSNSRSTAPT